MTTRTVPPAPPAPPAPIVKDVSGSQGSRSAQTTTALPGGVTGADQPAADRGRTSIADVVVAKVAGVAARETPAVYAAVLPAPAELAGRTESSLSPYSVRTRVRFSTRSRIRTHRGPHVR
ncbi:hypothetical protein [Streptomyces tauricus]|uniref:hypothetical protein n=1 Tax=Streptomyces tauricus TaxID=68274 RepID=UPI00390809E3